MEHEAAGSSRSLRVELVRQATLAASSHNTQCWKFAIGDSQITIVPDFARRSPLFAAIPARQCTRADYDGRPLAGDELRQLEQAAMAGDGVQLLLLTDKAAMEAVLELVVEGNRAQLNDPAFMRELRSWIRFNLGDAMRHGDGLSAACSGNPSLPAWLGRLVLRFGRGPTLPRSPRRSVAAVLL